MPISLSQISVLGERLRGLNQRARTDSEVVQLLLEMTGQQMALAYDPGFARSWVRTCRLTSDEELTDAHRLIHPPKPPAKYGRANLTNQTVFYAASNKRVALDEIRATAGDRIGAVTVRQRIDASHILQLVGEFEAILNSGASLVGVTDNEKHVVHLLESDREEMERAFLSDAVLAELFSDEKEEYKATANFANLVYGEGRGLNYPSVRTKGGLNLAVPAEVFREKYEVLFAEEFTVKSYLGNRCYEFERKRFSCDIAANGHIIWDSQKRLPYKWTITGGVSVPSAYVGWRVPR